MPQPGDVTVLHLTSSFPRWHGDHVAPFLLDLARVQHEAGHAVHVLAPHDGGARSREVLAGVQVHRFRYAPARWELLGYRGGLLGRARTPSGALLLPVYLLASCLAAVRTARRVRPDVLHAHWWLPAGACAVAAGRVLRVPVVVTLHGSDVTLLASGPAAALGRAVLRRCDLVAAVSADLAGQVTRLTGRECAVLRLPLRVPPQPDRPAGGRSRRLLAAGRLSPE